MHECSSTGTGGGAADKSRDSWLPLVPIPAEAAGDV